MREASRARMTVPAAPFLLAAALGLAACGGFQNPLAGDDAASAPAAPAVPNLAPDPRGVITYATYQVAVARDGDTIATVASRVGTTTEELARRNALPERLHAAPGRGAAPARRRVPAGAAGLDAGAISTQPLGGASGTAVATGAAPTIRSRTARPTR